MRCTMQMGASSIVDGHGSRGTSRVYETSAVRYEETQPYEELARDVVCFWTLRVDPSEDSHVQHLLPDLTVDVISVDDGPPFVMGPPTAAVHVPIPATTIKGVRLRAGAARRLFDASSTELLDRIVPLTEVLRAPRARGVEAADDVHAFVVSLLRWSAAENDPTVRSAINSARRSAQLRRRSVRSRRARRTASCVAVRRRDRHRAEARATHGSRANRAAPAPNAQGARRAIRARVRMRLRRSGTHDA